MSKCTAGIICLVADYTPFCTEQLCAEQADCIQDPANIDSLCVGSTRVPPTTATQFYGTCPSGFTLGPGQTCVDENECQLEREICGSVTYGKCENLFGSYECKCRVPKNNKQRLIFNLRGKCNRINVRTMPKKSGKTDNIRLVLSMFTKQRQLKS